MHDFVNSFLCEVYVNVEPAVEVEMVQADITARLSSTFSLDFLKVTADPASIRVLSVGGYCVCTDVKVLKKGTT